MKTDPVQKDLNKHLRALDATDGKEKWLQNQTQEIGELILQGNYYYDGHRYGPSDISEELASDIDMAEATDVALSMLIEAKDMFSEDFRTAAYLIQQAGSKALYRLARKFAEKELENMNE